ncbi:hypothetical protein SNEBB_006224 [Seison nebaliae]|nr:hypothetical protein SNEBB_006224 [Seison nebaliae]
MKNRLGMIYGKLAKFHRPIELIAVSKFKEIENIEEAYVAGQRDFGENYVKELFEKSHNEIIMRSCPDIRWHFIGNIQNNKINKLLNTRNLCSIQSIDSLKAIDLIEKNLKGKNIENPLNFYIQVNTSKEDQKNGITSFEELRETVEYILKSTHHLNLIGLMTIGAIDDSISAFKLLKEYQEKLQKIFSIRLKLSMGMTNDYEQAIEMGSDVVRIGRAIFGERKP